MEWPGAITQVLGLKGPWNFNPGAEFARGAEHQAPPATLLEQPPPVIAVATGLVQRVGMKPIGFALA